MRSESALRERRAQTIPTNGQPTARSHHPTLQINRYGNPPQLIIHASDHPKRPSQALIDRRTLLAAASAGDEAAKTTLRDTYHLSTWIRPPILNGRNILNNSRNGGRSKRHAR